MTGGPRVVKIETPRIPSTGPSSNEPHAGTMLHWRNGMPARTGGTSGGASNLAPVAANGGQRTPPGRPVALFVPSLGGGGAERVMLELARQLARRRFAVDFLVTRGGGALWGSVPENVRLLNLNSWKVVASLPGLVRYVRRERPAALLSTLEASNVTALLAKRFFARDLRLIVRQQSNCTARFRAGGFRTRMAAAAMKRLLPAADAVIAVSSGVAEDLRRTVPRAGPVWPVPNPVVTPELLEKARAPVDHPWFGDPRAPVVLTAGRLAAEKDQPTLLRAFAAVRKARPARLMVLGEGPDRGRLETLARELGVRDDVDFRGFQPNPFACMARARLFVLSSIYEGLPAALIEAMACGTPVVSTDCPSGPREILEGGRWGRLAPVGDWRALAQAMRDTLDDPIAPERLIARAGHYSAAASMARHLDLLHCVTARKTRPAGPS